MCSSRQYRGGCATQASSLRFSRSTENMGGCLPLPRGFVSHNIALCYTIFRGARALIASAVRSFSACALAVFLLPSVRVLPSRPSSCPFLLHPPFLRLVVLPPLSSCPVGARCFALCLIYPTIYNPYLNNNIISRTRAPIGRKANGRKDGRREKERGDAREVSRMGRNKERGARQKNG